MWRLRRFLVRGFHVVRRVVPAWRASNIDPLVARRHE